MGGAYATRSPSLRPRALRNKIASTAPFAQSSRGVPRRLAEQTQAGLAGRNPLRRARCPSQPKPEPPPPLPCLPLPGFCRIGLAFTPALRRCAFCITGIVAAFELEVCPWKCMLLSLSEPRKVRFRISANLRGTQPQRRPSLTHKRKPIFVLSNMS